MAVSKANVLESMGWLKDLQDTVNEEKFVQKEEGKQLSSNDFSDADKAKLDSLANFEPATATKLGGIKVGNGLEIQNDGTLSIDYDLPTASKTRKGGAKVGDGLDMDGETLKCTVEPGITNLVSHTQNGIMRATDKVKLDTIEDYAQVNTIERIKVNNSTLTITNKTVDIDLSGYVQGVNIAGAYHYKGTVNSYANLPTSGQVAGDVYNVRTAGGQDINGDDIKAGDNVAWTGVGWDVLAGTVDLSKFVEKVPGKDLSTEDFTTALKSKLEGLSNYSLPTASATTKGGVKIGTGLQMNGDTLNATATNYALPTASTTEKGGIKVGLGLRMNGETLNATATDYTLPTASSSTKGGVKVGTGLNMNGETLNCTIQGGTKVIAGTGLAFSNDTLNVTMTAGTNIVAGTGLSFSGDTLNCTLSGGGTYNDFTGATSIVGGASGLVPAPLAGANEKFLCGNGKWEDISKHVSIVNAGGSIGVVVGTDPTAVQGALWMDYTSDGTAVLKLRNGDYEYNYIPDSSNYSGSNLPALDTSNKGQIYHLGTTPATVNGGLWYEMDGDTPKLGLHYGKNYSFDFFYHPDSTTYKGGADGLYSYLPLQANMGDVLSNTSMTIKATPSLENFTINGKTYKGLRYVNTASNASTTTNSNGLKLGFATQLNPCTIDFWFSITSAHAIDIKSLCQINIIAGGNCTTNYTANTSTLSLGSYAITKPGRYHLAYIKSGGTVLFYVNGKYVAKGSLSGNWSSVCIFYSMPGTGAASYAYVDHLRIWNKTVWDVGTGNFDPPTMDAYI